MSVASGAAKLAAKPIRAAAESPAGRRAGIIAAVVAVTGIVAAIVAGAVALVPMLLTALAVWLYAWARGWEARRMRGLVLGLGGGLIAATMLWHWSWSAPFTAFWDGITATMDGRIGYGLVATAVLWVPLGMIAGFAWWAHYRDRMTTGRARNVRYAERHQERQKARRQASARTEATAGVVPLTAPAKEAPDLVIGPLSQTTGGVPRSAFDEISARHTAHLTVPAKAVDQHMVLLGNSGSGKTTLLRRLAISRTESEWARHAAGDCARPLIIEINCKGGSADDIVSDGGTFIDDMTRMGIAPNRVGLWPLDVRLDIWRMEPRDLQSTLLEMVKGSHEHFDELRESILHLVIDAPGQQPPKSSVEFLRRIHPMWMTEAWKHHAIESAMVEAVTEGRDPAWRDAILKYSNLFRNLGRSLDAGQDLTDFDALYMSIAGTKNPKEARAQAAAVIQLVTDLLHRRDRRKVTVFLDEYSAVAGDGGIGLAAMAERWRSLGGSVVAASQSWQGLGDGDDDRMRLVNTCSGGMLLMRTADGDQLTDRAGSMRAAEPSQHMVAGKWGAEGAVRMQDVFMVDPQRLREFEVGDVVYANGTRAYWGSVALVPPMHNRRPELPEHLKRTAITAGPAVPIAQLEAGIAMTVEEAFEDSAEGGASA